LRVKHADRKIVISAPAIPSRILILAGPNGAGKTTFAREFLPSDAACPTFVNADLIAAGIAPFAPESVAVRAARLMLEEIHRHAAQGVSFAFETTLSGGGYARMIPQWRQSGYRVELFFLSLPSVSAAIERVAERVRQGGHDIPEPTIRRRFDSGLANLRELYAPLVDSWMLFDNVGDNPAMLDWGRDPLNPRPIETARDPDLRKATAALIRAGQRARAIARQTRTAVITWKDGKVVRTYPHLEGDGQEG
jgi:predicted ABC-type ATPase